MPLGVDDALTARRVPQTGGLNLGGSVVTAGGKVFIAGTNDSRLRVFDAKTGKELWVERLEASGRDAMTYVGTKIKKQFDVIAAGGGGSFERT